MVCIDAVMIDVFSKCLSYMEKIQVEKICLRYPVVDPCIEYQSVLYKKECVETHNPRFSAS